MPSRWIPSGVHARLVEFDATGVHGSGIVEQQKPWRPAGPQYDFLRARDRRANPMPSELRGSAAAFGGVTTAGPVVLAGAFNAVPSSGRRYPGSDHWRSRCEYTGNHGSQSREQYIRAGSLGDVSGEHANNVLLHDVNAAADLFGADLRRVSDRRYGLGAEPRIPDRNRHRKIHDAVSDQRRNHSAVRAFSGNSCALSPFTGQTAGTFFTATSIGTLTGQALDTLVTPNIYLPDVAIASLTGSSGATFTMSAVENQAGSVGTYGSPFQANFDTLDALGRVSTSLALPFGPVFYIVGPNEALCIGQINGNPFFGYFQPQSAGPFHAATLKGAFIDGTLAPSASTVENFSGVVALDGVSAVTGTQDTSTTANNFAGQTVTGTYTNIAASLGSGIYTLTSPATFTGSLFIVSPTQFVVVSTTAGNANPVLIVVGN